VNESSVTVYEAMLLSQSSLSFFSPASFRWDIFGDLLERLIERHCNSKDSHCKHECTINEHLFCLQSCSIFADNTKAESQKTPCEAYDREKNQTSYYASPCVLFHFSSPF